MNVFEDIPESLQDELVEVLARGNAARVERIVSRGHRSPEGFWYDQDEDEWVLLLAGEAVLSFEDREDVQLRPGDHLLIPAHRRHRVTRTAENTDTVWLAVFLGRTGARPA